MDMTRSVLLAAFLIALAASSAAWAQAPRGADAAPIIMTPDQMKWLSVVGMPGVSEAWIVGGPDKPGPYVVRRHIEQGGRVPPRIDPQTIFLTVLSGEVYLGNDDEIDPRSARRLAVGTFVVIPANSYHYLWARHTEVVVQEWGTLPAKSGASPSSTKEPAPSSRPSP